MEQRLTRAPDVLAEELDGEFLLLRAGSAHAVHLDPVASAMWRVLQQPVSEDELALALADGFEVEVGRVTGDLGPALAMLRQHGLVVDEP